MLGDMTAFDVKLLAMIYNINPEMKPGDVYTGNFPDSDDQRDSGSRPGLLRNDVAVSLGNLARLWLH